MTCSELLFAWKVTVMTNHDAINVVARYCKHEQVPTCADQDAANHPFLEAPIRNHSLGDFYSST